MSSENDLTKALRRLALSYPQAELGIACQGTPLESSSFKARDKAFLFIGGTFPNHTIRVKLRESQAEATKLAAKQPDCYKVGAHGWTTMTLSAKVAPPQELLARWIDESYRAVADKKLLALLPEHGQASRAL